MRRALCVLSLGSLVACGGSSGSTFVPTPTPTAPPSAVVYTVTSDNANETADLTYEDVNGGTSQQNDVPLPWTYGPFSAKSGSFLYISAQKGKSGNCVTAAIAVNGTKAFEGGPSCGEFVIATASGSAP